MSKPRLRSALAALMAVAALLGLAAPAAAQKAAILSATRSGESAWWGYVKQKIVDTGLYPDGVDQIDIAFRDPTAMQLLPYQLVVILSSDYGMSSSDGVGNALGDYMAMAPKSSVLVFQPYTWQTGLFSSPAIGGSFLMNYALTTQGASASTSSTKRGMVLGNDPLVEGVTAFNCGSNCARVTGQTPVAGATVVAYWDDGSILAVRGKRRVDLNMYPADDAVITGSWKAAGGELITNAILYLTAPITQSPRKVSFPSTGLGGATAPVTVTFRNISDTPLDVTQIGIDGAGKSQFSWKSLRNPTPAMPYTFPVGASLKVDVTFQPQVQGTHKATLYLALAGGANRVEMPLDGTSKGNLWVSMSPIDFGGIASGTTAGPVTVRLKNLGAAPIDLEKPVLGDSTHYTMKTAVPDAKITMFTGATYSFEVTFNPGMMPGEFPTDIVVKSTDASSPLTIPVRGLAGPPKAQVPYTSLLLPDVPTGAKGLPMEIMLTNTGNSELLVNEISADKTDFLILNPPSTMSPIKLKARESTVFQLVFAPQMEGLRAGKLTIKTNEPAPMGMPDSDKVILLAGNGTKPKFRVDPTTQLDFGTVNIGQPTAGKVVSLINEGDGDLLIKEVSVAMGMGADSFVVSTPDPVPFYVRAGTTVPVTVTFAPRQAGSLSATLRVVSDLMMGGSAMLALKGEANGAVAKLDVSKLDFGDRKVKQSTTKSVTLTNQGNKELTLIKARLNPMVGIYALMAPADGTKIAAGASVTINVVCLPAMVGTVTGKLELETDDPAVAGGTKFTVPLTVNGVVGNVSVTPATVDFMVPLYVGQKSDMQTIKVKNTGNVVIDSLVVKISGTDAGDFSFVPGFKSKLLPTEESEIGFVFEPRVAKTLHSATAVLEADGVQVPMTVGLKASSISPVVGVQPGLLRFENTLIMERSQPKFITLSNDGAQPLELEVTRPTGEDFEIDLTDAKLMLGPGDATKVAVFFTPKTKGSKSETIDVRLKGTIASIAKIDIEGVATDKPKEMPMEMGGCAMSTTPSASRSAAPLAFIVFALAGLALLRRRRYSA